MIRHLANQEAYSGATADRGIQTGIVEGEKRSLEQAQFSGTRHSLSAIVDAEFAVDVFEVLLNSASGDDEVLRRLSIGESLGYEI